MVALTNEFYTLIPHVVGRSREGLASKVISSMQAFEEKQELLQLMRDMLRVTNEGKALQASEIDMKYLALQARIFEVPNYTDEYKNVEKHVLRTKVWALVCQQSICRMNLVLITIFLYFIVIL